MFLKQLRYCLIKLNLQIVFNSKITTTIIIMSTSLIYSIMYKHKLKHYNTLNKDYISQLTTVPKGVH